MIIRNLIIFQIISNAIGTLIFSILLEQFLIIGIQILIISLIIVEYFINISKLKLITQFLISATLFENYQYIEWKIVGIVSLCYYFYGIQQLIMQNSNARFLVFFQIFISCGIRIVVTYSTLDYEFIQSIIIVSLYLICIGYYLKSTCNFEIQQTIDIEPQKSNDFVQILTQRTISRFQETSILDNLNVGVVVMTKDHEFQYSNEIASKMLQLGSKQQVNEDNIIMIIKQLLKKCINEKIQSMESLHRPSLTRINQLISSIQLKQKVSNQHLDDHFIKQIDPITSILQQQQHNDFTLGSSQFVDNKYEIRYNHNGKIKSFNFYFKKHNQFIIVTIIDDTSNILRIDQNSKHIFQHQLINSFSHELKTPLNCTQQLLEVLSSRLDQSLVQEIINPIQWQTDLLLCQINDILDYASFEINDFSSNYALFGLEELLEECKKIYVLACKQKGISIEIKSLTNTKHYINNDIKRLKQVIINLLNNSIKFTAQNGIITLEIFEEVQPNLFAIKVIDSGLGLSNEELIRLKYSLEEENQQNDYEKFHVGLGLKVANKLVQGFSNLKQGLKIISTLNKGTEISFYIEDFMNEMSSVSDSAVIERDVGRRLSQLGPLECKFLQKTCQCNKILIVDDIPFNHHALSLFLNELNEKAESVYDGLQAIETVTQRLTNNKCHPYYQLILMDIEMPQVNGFEASLKIKQILGNKADQTSIVMCSAYDNPECIKMSKRSLMTDILSKPITRTSLQLILEKYLK